MFVSKSQRKTPQRLSRRAQVRRLGSQGMLMCMPNMGRIRQGTAHSLVAVGSIRNGSTNKSRYS